MTWQFNPYAIPLFISAVPVAYIVYAAWRQRANLAARMFLGFTGGALGLVLAYALELSSANLEAMLFWLRFEYLFHWAMVFWLLFAIAYSGYETWLTRRRILSLFIVPAIIIALVWTNQSHGLIWSTTAVQRVGSLALFDRTYGAGFWIWMVYLAAMLLVGDFILLRKAVRAPGYFRGQLIWLVLACCIPAVAIILTIARVTPIEQLDLSPYGVALACLPVAVSLFRFRLFDLIPAAYERVIESMDDAVLVCDDKARIVEVNSAAEQLTGKPTSKLVGCPVGQIFEEIVDLNVGQGSLDASQTYQEIAVQVRGTPHYFDLRASLLRNRQNVVTGQVFVLREITDRKQAERHSLDLAIERERLHVLETFIQDASHDFRTPISGIFTAAYLMDKLGESANDHIAAVRQSLNGIGSDQLDVHLHEAAEVIAKMHDKVQTTRAGAERLEKLVESILEVLQLEREPQLSSTLVDLNRLIAERIQVNSAAAAAKGLRLQFEPDDTVPHVSVDQWKLGRAVQKLMDNAIQYTPQDGVLTVSTYRRADEVVIQISDTGIGISAGDLPHIFEPFYRVDLARSSTTGGVGLGLSIARRIVEAHAGRVEAESVPNQGSVFRIHLPLNSETIPAETL